MEKEPIYQPPGAGQACQNDTSASARVGIVVIGRNEAQNLPRSLASVRGIPGSTVLFVDSGSTDHSAQLAREHGVAVLCLDARSPFSAARARREGAGYLLRTFPSLEYIQFLDGDSALCTGWIMVAVQYLEEFQSVGVVCGGLTEKDPTASVYNQLAALQWKAHPGDINHCGGIFMVRRSVYQDVGGFNAALLTGEEPDLCARIRATGARIVRLDAEMAQHDSGISTFGQWWARAVWGGHGDAIEQSNLCDQVNPHRKKETRSMLFWGAALPIIGVGSALGALYWSWAGLIMLGVFLLYLGLFARIARYRLTQGDSLRETVLYAFFCVLRKIAVAQGFLSNKLSFGTRPDPHSLNRVSK